jgi:uncharacterized protein (TIGR02594 family)
MMNFLEWLLSLFKKTEAPSVSVNERIMEIARGELGQKEIRGGENPRIIEYHKSTTLKASEDEVAWCASFACWVVEKAGLKSTKSAAARSFLKWGNAVELKDAKEGDIVVFKRGSSSWQGHVAFYLSHDSTYITVLGGNQGKSVSIAKYSAKNLLGVRRSAENVVKASAIGVNSKFPNKEWEAHALRTVQASKLVSTKLSDAWFVNRAENWVHLLAAMCYFESGFTADKTYRENFKNSKGETVISTGLFQLSYESVRGYGFKTATTESLKNPFENITIAVKILENWVVKHGTVSGTGEKPYRGGAMYWAVLRGPKLRETIKLYQANSV